MECLWASAMWRSKNKQNRSIPINNRALQSTNLTRAFLLCNLSRPSGRWPVADLVTISMTISLLCIDNTTSLMYHLLATAQLLAYKWPDASMTAMIYICPAIDVHVQYHYHCCAGNESWTQHRDLTLHLAMRWNHMWRQSLTRCLIW